MTSDLAFDALLSADALVPDHDIATHVFVRELGMQRVADRHVHRPSGQSATWSFPRIHPDRGLAPTMLEILSADRPDRSITRPLDYAYLPEIAASQGERPVQCHSSPIGVPDVDAVVERLERSGARFRLDEPTERLPFPRLWVGFARDEPGVYEPTADGGLRLEIVPSAANRLSMKLTPPPSPANDGTIIRVASRTFLVSDLTRSLTAIERHFGWEPLGPVTRGTDAIDRATLGFRHPRSATLELLAPSPSARGYETDIYNQWGPGPFSLRFAVDGLGSLRDRLAPHTPINDAEPLPQHNGIRLLRPAERAIGTAFEFIEWDGT
jgi:hypothetical protein